MPFSVTSPSFTFLKVTEDKSTAVLEFHKVCKHPDTLPSENREVSLHKAAG